MSRPSVFLTGVERSFGDEELIVSKTDCKGRITYANRVFQRLSGYSERELLHAPHNILRHPAMPRCVFKLLWDTIENGREIFAYVLNRAKNGDEYWVFAHVTPSYDHDGALTGYHSNRRSPNRAAVAKVIPLYRALLEIEHGHGHSNQGMALSFAAMVKLLTDNGVDYDQFVLSL